MGVDQSRCDDFGLQHAEASGDRHRFGGADGYDLAVLDHHNTVSNRRAGHGVYHVAANGDLRNGALPDDEHKKQSRQADVSERWQHDY